MAEAQSALGTFTGNELKLKLVLFVALFLRALHCWVFSSGQIEINIVDVEMEV